MFVWPRTHSSAARSARDVNGDDLDFAGAVTLPVLFALLRVGAGRADQWVRGHTSDV